VLPIFWGCCYLRALPGPTRRPLSNSSPQPMALIRMGKLKRYAIRSTYKLPAFKLALSRSWEWEPKPESLLRRKRTGRQAGQGTYLRSQLSTAPANGKTKLSRPSSTTIIGLSSLSMFIGTLAQRSGEGQPKLPIGKGTAKLVSVKYPAEVGGYHAGRHLGSLRRVGSRVVNFIYHRGGPKPPSTSQHLGGLQKAGPLLVSTEHRGTADASRPIFSSRMWPSRLAGSDSGWTRNRKRATRSGPSTSSILASSWNED